MMVEIAASRDRVFSFMTNPEHVKQWQPDVVESIPLTNGGVRRGTRWRVTVEEFGRRFDVETSVVDLVLNTRLVFETNAPTADVQVDYRFFEHGPNTRVELATTLNVGQLMLLMQFGNMSKDVTKYNTRLFAEKVMPKLKPLFAEWENRWWPQPMERRQRATLPAFTPATAAE